MALRCIILTEQALFLWDGQHQPLQLTPSSVGTAVRIQYGFTNYPFRINVLRTRRNYLPKSLRPNCGETQYKWNTPYLANDLYLTFADANCCHHQSADSPTLVVRPTRRSTLDDRAFLVAAARAWNSLPPAIRDAPSLLSFRSRQMTLYFELTLA